LINHPAGGASEIRSSGRGENGAQAEQNQDEQNDEKGLHPQIVLQPVQAVQFRLPCIDRWNHNALIPDGKS
jgi:hypothetical protein